MTEEHEDDDFQEEFTADDYFRFGNEIAWRFCGCNGLDYQGGVMLDLLLDLAAGVLRLKDSAADFRLLRDSRLAELKDPKIRERIKKNGGDPAVIERNLNAIDPEEEFRMAAQRHQRLARDILESCWGEKLVQQWIHERWAENPFSPAG